MRRILIVIVLAVTISVVASSQTNNGQTGRSRSEQELITLSREFVKTSIGAMAVEMGEVKMTPSGPMSSAEVKEQWEAVGIKDTKVHIDGDKAVVTGQVIFGGHSPEANARNTSSRVTIHFLKRKDGWKFVRGCLGDCGDK